jgi:hypothetical protein
MTGIEHPHHARDEAQDIIIMQKGEIEFAVEELGKNLHQTLAEHITTTPPPSIFIFDSIFEGFAALLRDVQTSRLACLLSFHAIFHRPPYF